MVYFATAVSQDKGKQNIQIHGGDTAKENLHYLFSVSWKSSSIVEFLAGC